MTDFVLQETARYVDRPSTATPAVVARGQGIDAWREEIKQYLAVMQNLRSQTSEEVFMSLSGWTARAVEMKIRLADSDLQRSRAFITRVLDPFIEECDRQFKYHSRMHATREFEQRMTGGIT